MPSNRSLHLMNAAHRALITVTGGRVGWEASGMPILELTTVGRKSGEKRSTMLSSPLNHDGAIVIVASRGGDDRHPAWYLNLLANPEVEVSLQGAPKRTMHARAATPAERAELWPLVTRDHANYAGYQLKTEREIPLVLLEATQS